MNFRSKLEERLWKELQKSIGRRKTISITYESDLLPYQKFYLPDFVISRKNGTKTFIEAKGYFRPADRAKLRSVIKHNPDIDLRMVFQSLKKKDVDWCLKNKIPYAIGSVPNDWL